MRVSHIVTVNVSFPVISSHRVQLFSYDNELDDSFVKDHVVTSVILLLQQYWQLMFGLTT